MEREGRCAGHDHTVVFVSSGQARKRVEGTGLVTYSSRIQLPTDAPPQLIPIPILCARLSRLSFWMGRPLTEMGLAPFSNLDMSDDSLVVSEGRERSIF